MDVCQFDPNITCVRTTAIYTFCAMSHMVIDVKW